MPISVRALKGVGSGGSDQKGEDGCCLTKIISGCCYFISFILIISCSLVFSTEAHAQVYSGELAGVQEFVIEKVLFDDKKASAICSLSEDELANKLKAAFSASSLPAVYEEKVRPTVSNIARVEIETHISTHVDETLGCVSWITMSAETRGVVTLPQLKAPRDLTMIFWRHSAKAFSGQTSHPGRVAEVLKRMVDRLSVQYMNDQARSAPR